MTWRMLCVARHVVPPWSSIDSVASGSYDPQRKGGFACEVLGSARQLGRVAVIIGVAVAVAIPALSAGVAAQAPGTGKPPAGTGMNTAAAFANPLCREDAGPYGNLDFVVEGGGPVCVAEWKKGTNNGGATYQGVTKDSIDVVVLVPNEQQLAGGRPGQTPVNQATGETGTVTDAFKDTFAAFEHQAHQTYGRKINLVFVTSSGDDETAQRAMRSA